jgi:hypothetical protein
MNNGDDLAGSNKFYPLKASVLNTCNYAALFSAVGANTQDMIEVYYMTEL